MADPILLIAQISASLTSLVGIIAVAVTYSATQGLSKDSFRSLISRSGWFLRISVIGVTIMTGYHIIEGFGLDAADLLNNLWYSFMFLALLFSMYFSYTIIKFGRPFKRN